MKLDLRNVKMTVASVNGRSELHGEERQPAGDIKLEGAFPNDILDRFDPRLKKSFYHLEKGRQDLAEQGKGGEPGFLPHLIFPALGSKQSWGEEVNARVSIKPGAGKLIVLEDAKVNNISFELQEGGTVLLSLRVQAHPDEGQFGRLYGIIQNDVRVNITQGPDKPAEEESEE